MNSCIVVGAGISGLICAHILNEEGIRVKIIDKARGVGGRMATRRLKSEANPEKEGIFDHGAQYITVRDARLARFIDEWMSEGVVQEWCRGFPSGNAPSTTDGFPRYVGAHGMTSAPKYLAAGLDIVLNQRVTQINSVDGKWQVLTEDGDKLSSHALILSAPVPQSLHMLDNGSFTLPDTLRKELEEIRYDPCIAVLAELDRPSALPAPGGMKRDDTVISWICDNTMKGISPDVNTLTIHTTPEFAVEHWDTDYEEIADIVLKRVSEYIGPHVVNSQVHRWRYSIPVNLAKSPYLVGSQNPPLIFSGDAFGGARVEGAFISGLEAAETLIKMIDRKMS